MKWLMMILTFGFNPAVEPLPEFLPFICIIPQSQVSPLFSSLPWTIATCTVYIPQDKPTGSWNHTVYATLSSPEGGACV